MMTCHYHDLGSASDWLKQISLATPPMAEVLVDLHSDTSSVWNFCACYTGKPVLENQWLRREMLAVFC